MSEANATKNSASTAVSRWMIVALLAVIATCLLLEVGALTSPAGAQVAQAGSGGGVFAVAGKVTAET